MNFRDFIVGRYAASKHASPQRGGFLVPMEFTVQILTELQWASLEAGATTRERRFWRAARREMERRFAAPKVGARAANRPGVE